MSLNYVIKLPSSFETPTEINYKEMHFRHISRGFFYLKPIEFPNI